eukprot:6211532-Pleurochrysis_carterae.AAC.1
MRLLAPAEMPLLSCFSTLAHSTACTLGRLAMSAALCLRERRALAARSFDRILISTLAQPWERLLSLVSRANCLGALPSRHCVCVLRVAGLLAGSRGQPSDQRLRHRAQPGALSLLTPDPGRRASEHAVSRRGRL